MQDPDAPWQDRLRDALTGYVASETIQHAVSTLTHLAEAQRAKAVEFSLRLAERSPKATVEYVRGLPEVALLATPEEMAAWAGLGLRLAGRSPHAAVKYFRQSPDILNRLVPDIRLATLTLASRLAEQDYGVALEFIRQAPEAAPRLAPDEVVRWAEIGLRLAQREYLLAVEYFRQTPQILAVLTPQDLQGWADLGQRLAIDEYLRAIEYFRLSPRFFESVPPAARVAALELGAQLAAASPESTLTYIRMGLEGLASLSPALQAEVLTLATTLAAPAPAAALDVLRHAPDLLTTMGAHAFRDWAEQGLAVLRRRPEQGRAYFRLDTKTTRRVIEHAMPGLGLKDLGRTLALYVKGLTGRAVAIRSTEDLPDAFRASVPPGRPTTDGRTLYLPARLSTFPTPADNFRVYKLMALHIAAQLDLGTSTITAGDFGSPAIETLWHLIEAGRVDAHLQRCYPGLRADFDWLASEHRTHHPRLVDLDPRAAALEVVARGLPLDESERGVLPQTVTDLIVLGEALAKTAHTREATVMDSLRVAGLLTKLLERVLGPPRPDLPPVDQVLHQGAINEAVVRAAAGAVSARAVALAERLEAEGITGRSEPGALAAAVRQALDRAIRDGKVDGLRLGEADQARTVSDEDLLTAIHDDLAGLVPEKALTPVAGRMYQYDEWDREAQDYRAAWCQLIEQPAETGPPEFYDQTLLRHAGMVGLLRRSFEALRPEGFRKLKRQSDGEEIDLDAALEALLDVRARTTPSDRVYTRRLKRQRDVAVCLLIDMSGSTNRQIHGAGPHAPGRRVIDVEKEGLIVLLEALNAVGDEHAVYGFSGQGRGRCDFYIMKDYEEPKADQIRERIGGIRPLVQNRDGAAIRHAAWKLSRREARIKLLILLSDGRPLDTDYSGDYALEDTRMALSEAGRRGIHPYCITVDREAQDYLSRMYRDVQYTIIDDVQTLPERLPVIYHRLTS